MKRFLRAALTALLLGAGVAWAGPLDEGVAAAERGDYAKALTFIRPLAANGNAAAQYNLGVLYYKGQGVPQNYVEAASWFRLAAAQGHPTAQNNVGATYEAGQGVPKDYGEAVKWYRLAAAQSDASAQYNLGVLYYKGQGVPQNYLEAASWFRLAAAQGHAPAQTNLGAMYGLGLGAPQDYSEALKWYRFAAAQGHASAQLNLGSMYREGRGVPQSSDEAIKWYRLAAAQGNASAQFNTGLMYYLGQGVAQDSVRAQMWFNLAAAAGNANGATGRDDIAKLLSQQQIAEAQKLTRECQARNFKGCDPVPIAGRTVADAKLKFDTGNLLALFAKATARCESVDSIDTSPMLIDRRASFDAAGTLVQGSIKERWVAKLCGQSLPFVVTFTAAEGGISFTISKEQQ